MFRTSQTALALAFLLIACGGGDGAAPEIASTSEIASADHAELGEITSKFLEELNNTLDGVTDKASAEAARPALDGLVAQMEPIQKRRTELMASGSAQDKLAFAQSMMGTIGGWNRFMANLARLAPERESFEVLEEPIEQLSKFMSNRAG